MTDNNLTLAGESAGPLLTRATNPPRRILVVDDEPDIRQLNAEVLQNFGYHVDTAEDGHAGWEALRATRHSPESYALLITDHDMPGLSGLALVKKARAARMALPVIMATGRLAMADLMTRYPWLQPAATLVKPYSIGQLLRTVESALRMADGVSGQLAWPNYQSPVTIDCLIRFATSRRSGLPRINKAIP